MFGFALLRTKSDLISGHFVVWDSAQIETHRWLSQKCLVLSVFLFKAPQVPSDNLSPAKQILPGGKGPLVPGDQLNIT